MPGSKPGALGHLATPHRQICESASRAHASSASSRGDRAAPATTRLRHEAGNADCASCACDAVPKPTKQPPPVPVRQAWPWRDKLRQHGVHPRLPAPEDRLEGIAEDGPGNEVGYCRRGSIPRQFRGLEQFPGRHVDARIDQQVPGRRQLDRRAAARRRLRPRHCGRARTPARRRRAPGPSSASRVLAQAGAPQPVQHAQHGGRVRGAAAEAAAGGDLAWPRAGRRPAACRWRPAGPARRAPAGPRPRADAAVSPPSRTDAAVLAHAGARPCRPSRAGGTPSAARADRRRGGR